MLQGAALAVLRRLEAERAHRLTLQALRLGLAPRQRGPDDPLLACRVMGLALPNPVGLAAGFDKDAEVVDAMLALGFGFVEAGSLTPRPQAGNPRPRLFRLPEDRAVINRLGFNNGGLAAAAARLAGRRGRAGVVGANLGANKDSADRIEDYVTGLAALGPLVDYVTINVSSPNTPGLRALQARGELDLLLPRVAAARAALARPVPLLLKIAPDLSGDELGPVIEAAVQHGIDGLIVGNTTTGHRERLLGAAREEQGGLSGAPLFAPSTALLAEAYRLCGGRLVLIGTGGVASGADAYAKIRAGASLVQLYTGLVYHGPGLLARIKQELAALLRRDGFAGPGEAVGSATR